MKRNHLHALLLLASLLFVSCETEETYQVQDVSYADKSELYGVWKWKDNFVGMRNYDPPPYYYVLNGGESYYLSRSIFSESSEGFIFLGKMQWELNAARSIAMSPSWKYLRSKFSIDRCDSKHPINGVNYCIYTVSNSDSLVEAVRLYRKKAMVTEGDEIYEINPFVDTLKFAIASDVVDKNKQRFLRTVTDSCYQANADASTMENLCKVTEFQKVEMPELAQILANVDTLSSTEIWQVLEDEAAKNQN